MPSEPAQSGSEGSGLASFLPSRPDSYRELSGPVGGAKLSCHGKSRLRLSPGNENAIYLSLYII